MKTINEIKDEVARQLYDCSFSQATTFMHKFDIQTVMEEVAKRYAKEVLKEASVLATIKYDRWGRAINVDKDSILKIIKYLK